MAVYLYVHGNKEGSLHIKYEGRTACHSRNVYDCHFLPFYAPPNKRTHIMPGMA